MKTIVVSTPKSGTYLMRELLDNIGLHSSYLHITMTGIYDYSKVSLEEGRSNPYSCFTACSLKKSLSSIKDNSFALSHLPCTDRNIELLSDFNIIYLTRDIKESILSFMLFSINTGRANTKIDNIWLYEKDHKKQFLSYIKTRGASIVNKHKSILPWIEQRNVNIFNFKNLIKYPYEEVDRLANILGIYPTKAEIEKIIADSYGKETITSSPKHKIDYWSKEAHNEIEKLL